MVTTLVAAISVFPAAALTFSPAALCSPGRMDVAVVASRSGDFQNGSSVSSGGMMRCSSSTVAGCWDRSSTHTPGAPSGNCGNGSSPRRTAVAVMTPCASGGIESSACWRLARSAVVTASPEISAATGTTTSSRENTVRARWRRASRQPMRSAGLQRRHAVSMRSDRDERIIIGLAVGMAVVMQEYGMGIRNGSAGARRRRHPAKGAPSPSSSRSTSSGSVASMMEPSRRKIVRSAHAANRGSWVTSSTAAP